MLTGTAHQMLHTKQLTALSRFESSKHLLAKMQRKICLHFTLMMGPFPTLRADALCTRLPFICIGLITRTSPGSLHNYREAVLFKNIVLSSPPTATAQPNRS
ncbi:hypothetical protein KSP39_PZI005508 [Platanthera zijinensis]|uniref:Uncharacterized protein n=1 Tax=Platanthera zijinensis TaxID=2320716 RepID=A0AAP0BR52_9ASPA